MPVTWVIHQCGFIDDNQTFGYRNGKEITTSLGYLFTYLLRIFCL